MPTVPIPPYKIFVSTVADRQLSPPYLAIKRRVISLLQDSGLAPQLLGVMGMSIAMARNWDMEIVDKVMRSCQGAVLLGFARWEFVENRQLFRFATEYTHSEGAVALMHHLPTLFVIDNGVLQRGIFSPSQSLIDIPRDVDEFWVDSHDFKQQFENWREQVDNRYHVFLGYSSGATSTATAILNFLRERGVRVLDWRTDFQAGGTILEQIEQAERSCLGGIFLFTKDDELKLGDTTQAAPRDNVIFEAGYFINAKGDKRVLIILEEGAKIPADLGGQIYLLLKDRSNISGIETRLAKFIQDRL